MPHLFSLFLSLFVFAGEIQHGVGFHVADQNGKEGFVVFDVTIGRYVEEYEEERFEAELGRFTIYLNPQGNYNDTDRPAPMQFDGIPILYVKAKEGRSPIDWDAIQFRGLWVDLHGARRTGAGGLAETTVLWDILGDSFKDRALRAGLGAGLTWIQGPGTDPHDHAAWTGFSPPHAKITGVFMFTRKLGMEHSVTVRPFVTRHGYTDGTPDIHDYELGARGQLSSQLFYRATRNASVILSNIFEADVAFADSDRLHNKYGQVTFGGRYLW